MKQSISLEVGESGFRAVYCATDMCLYIKDTDRNVTVVGVYVDDVLVTGTSTDVVERIFDSMVSLAIKDLGSVNKFLSLRIMLGSEAGYVLDQELIIDLLSQNHGWNGTRTPIGEECQKKQRGNARVKIVGCFIEGELASIKAFQSLVGSLPRKMHSP